MKKWIRGSIIFLFVITIGLMIYLDTTKYAPHRLTTRFSVLEDEEIPEQMNDVRMVYFSDVHLKTLDDFSQVDRLVDKLIQANPDILLFGGDLFDHPSSRLYTTEQKDALVEKLKSIPAPLGKFAILGDHDLESEDSKNMVTDILYRSDFEVLINQTMRIRNRGSQSVVLVGLDCQLGGYPDFTSPFNNIANYDYAIVLSHTPDAVTELPQDRVDVTLAGHSHGGQIYFPLVGSLYQDEGATLYNRGTQQVGDIQLDITNGVGTIRTDARLLSEAEIVVYTLQHKQQADKNNDNETPKENENQDSLEQEDVPSEDENNPNQKDENKPLTIQ